MNRSYIDAPAARGGAAVLTCQTCLAVWAAQAVSTRTLLGKSIKFFLAQTYSTAIRPIDIFRTSALEYTVDPDDKTEVGGDWACTG